MNKQLNLQQVAPLIIQYLQNETLPATKENIYNNIKESIGIPTRSVAAVQQFNKILEEMVLRGYIYTIDNVSYSITKDASEGIQINEHNEFTADYSQPHKELLSKYNDPMKSVKAVMPYWEHFKQNHPEYAEVYEDMESMKEFSGFLAEVWSVIKNKEVQPYKDVEPKYVYSDRLASSIDNVIASCLMRAIRFSRRPKLKNIMIPTESVINTTRNLLGVGFDSLKMELVSSFGIGSILSKENIKKYMSEILKDTVSDPKEIDYVVRQTIGKLMLSIDPMVTGILFEGTNKDVIITTLRYFLFDAGAKSGPKATIVNRVLTNDSGVQYLSDVFSNVTIPPGTKLTKCKFNDITINKIVAEGVDFSNSTFSNATITKDKFKGAKFIGCQLDVKIFSANEIQDTDFTNSGGYNSEDVDFSNNIGKPIGLVIQKAIYNTDDFNALVKGGLKRKQYNALPLTQAERKIADPLINHLHGFLTHKNRKLSSLEFNFKTNLSWDISVQEADPAKVYILYAIYAAEAVLNIFESAYPQDNRPRKAIEIAKICFKNPTKENKAVAKAAAAAAADAAYAAYAAAYAVAAAADAAAAAAAADAAYAAYAVERAKKSAELFHINIDFEALLAKAKDDIWDYIQVTGSLRFSEELPAIPSDKTIIKQDLENMLNTGQKADWLISPEAKSIVIQLNKQGDLAQMGLAQSMGKIIGMLSGPKEIKPTKEQMEAEQQTQQEQKLQEVFQQHSGRGTMSKQALLEALPEEAVNLRNLIKQFPQEQLDAQQISQIYTSLLNSQYDSKAGDSVLLQQQLRDISQFPHGSRIDDITTGRRNNTGTPGYNYPNTFGIVLEPNLNGLPPEVAAIIEQIDPNSAYNFKAKKPTSNGMEFPLGPHSQHWIYGFASSRVRPTYIVDNSGVETTTAKRNVWLNMENQSDALQNVEEYFVKFGVDKPFALKDPETLALSRLYDAVGGDMHKVVPTQDILKDAVGFTQDTLKKLSKEGYVTMSRDTISFDPGKEKVIRALKSVTAFRNYTRDWPEMCMLEIIKRAIEHGGVDEVWVPTAEDLLKAKSKGVDWRPYYDYPALRLGGVPFHPAMDITRDSGSGLWSKVSKEQYPKTWYAIDLLPYKLDLRKGSKCQDRQNPESVATITDLNKLTKFKKSLYTMEVITPNLADSQIVVVYQLTTAPNKYFISSCKDFNDRYTNKQLYSSTDLRFSMDVYSSVYKEKVLKYVEKQLVDYPYLKDAPRNMLIASGITRRADEFKLGPEEIQELAEEMQKVAGVPMDLPIVNYVKLIITAVDYVKNISPEIDEDKKIDRILRNLTQDKIATDLVRSVIKNILPEALKQQPKEPDEPLKENNLSYGPAEEGDVMEPEEHKLTTPEKGRGLADNDARKKYEDLKFDNKQISPQSLERTKQSLVNDYLDDLALAKKDGNTEKVDKINRMLQYLSAESSMIIAGAGGLHPLKHFSREMNFPLKNECIECGRNTQGHPSQKFGICRNADAKYPRNYNASPGLEFGRDFEYAGNGKTPKAEVSGN